MKLWVAYNDWGDLVAEAHSYHELLVALDDAGYDWDEVVIGVV